MEIQTEKKFKTAVQDLEDHLNGCRTIRLLCCACLATAIFMGLVYLPLWSMMTKPYVGFIPELALMVVAGIFMTQLLFLSAYREITKGKVVIN